MLIAALVLLAFLLWCVWQSAAAAVRSLDQVQRQIAGLGEMLAEQTAALRELARHAEETKQHLTRSRPSSEYDRYNG